MTKPLTFNKQKNLVYCTLIERKAEYSFLRTEYVVNYNVKFPLRHKWSSSVTDETYSTIIQQDVSLLEQGKIYIYINPFNYYLGHVLKWPNESIVFSTNYTPPKEVQVGKEVSLKSLTVGSNNVTAAYGNVKGNY